MASSDEFLLSSSICLMRILFSSYKDYIWYLRSAISSLILSYLVSRKCCISSYFRSRCFLIAVLSSINFSTMEVSVTISVDCLRLSFFKIVFSSVRDLSRGDILIGSMRNLTSSCFI